MNGAADRWLLLIHHIPPSPAYLRARTLRRVTNLGAVALKNSTYLLPDTESALEDLEWVRREIVDAGGEAWIVQGAFAGGSEATQVRDRFREVRGEDYRSIAADARVLLSRAREAGSANETAALMPEWRRLGRRLAATRKIDFFSADNREEAEVLMTSIERVFNAADGSSGTESTQPLRSRTWATRAGVKIDRMASAWLIRRFIDPAATFLFLAPDEPCPPGVLRFDTFDGEFTHDGERCTFEVLLAATGHPADAGLAVIGQAVHDLDLKDDRYQRPEAAGIAAVIGGIIRRHSGDAQRLAESASFFDALYAGLDDQ